MTVSQRRVSMFTEVVVTKKKKKQTNHEGTKAETNTKISFCF